MSVYIFILLENLNMQQQVEKSEDVRRTQWMGRLKQLVFGNNNEFIVYSKKWKRVNNVRKTQWMGSKHMMSSPRVKMTVKSGRRSTDLI